MASQFLTAGGAFLGTFLGILIAESAGAGSVAGMEAVDLGKVVVGQGKGFLGTSVGYADLSEWRRVYEGEMVDENSTDVVLLLIVLPATAGGFLYIASVSVVPELLAESRTMKQAFKEVSLHIPRYVPCLAHCLPVFAVLFHGRWGFGHGRFGLERMNISMTSLTHPKPGISVAATFYHTFVGAPNYGEYARISAVAWTNAPS